MKLKKITTLGLALLLLQPQAALASGIQTSKQNMFINNEPVKIEAYNLNDNNYYKLRDILKELSNTGSNFNVKYDPKSNGVRIVGGEKYQEVDRIYTPPKNIDSYVMSAQKLAYNDKIQNVAVVNIEGYNYLSIRDLALLLNIGVGYDYDTNTVMFGKTDLNKVRETYKSREKIEKQPNKEPENKIDNQGAGKNEGKNEASLSVIVSETKNVNGIALNTVTVGGNKLDFSVVKANDGLNGAEPFNSMIKRSGARVAVNANFFDAYKSLKPYGNIVKDGEIVHGIGNDAAFISTKDGKNYVSEVEVINKLQVNGKNISAWYTNNGLNDNTAISVFNKYYGQSVKLPAGKYITAVDNKIKNYDTAGKVVNIPSNGYVVYFASNSIDMNYLNTILTPGADVKHSIEYKGDGRIAEDSVKTLVAAGPILVKNGVNVSTTSKAKYESKIRNQNTQRSAIGVKADGSVVIVTGKATINKLADAMIGLGCVEATNLDGGASSGLYANGKLLTNPGRNLNTSLIIK